MTNRLKAIQLAIVALFASAFILQQIGSAGRFRTPFFQNEIYPLLRFISTPVADLKFRLRGPRHPAAKIVIVEVDSNSIEALGRWPWRRDLVAYLIDKTFQAGARTVGLDVIFSEPERRVPEELVAVLRKKGLGGMLRQFDTDRVLAHVMETYADRLVLSWATETDCRPLFLPASECPVLDPAALETLPAELPKFAYSEIHLPWKLDASRSPLPSAPTLISNLKEFNLISEHQGFANGFLDPDGVIRRASLLLMVGGKPQPSLPLELARVALDESLSVDIGQYGQVSSIKFRRANREIPVNGAGTIEVNYRGPARTFTYLSAADVLRDEDEVHDEMNRKLAGISKTSLLKDSIVLIGVSALALGDIRATPFDPHVPGVEVQANILDNLLNGDPLQASYRSGGILLLFLLITGGAYLLAHLAERWEAPQVLLLFALTLAALLVIDTRLFAANLNWDTSLLYLELIALVLVTLGAKYAQEERKKKFLRVAFSKYVSPTVVDTLLRDPAKLSLGGQKKSLTVLFSDIRSFTTLSERMDPRRVAEFLNEYFGLMTEIVFRHGGTLDKYIGDALMAFWGAPLDDPMHAVRACNAARAMQSALAAQRASLRLRFGLDVHIGVGTHSGTASVGNMGSQKSFGYTAIGDDVNLASRLQAATKIYQVGILTSRQSLEAIQAEGASLPAHRVIDEVKVKGRTQRVEIVEILGDGVSREGLDLFQQGRARYRDRDWTGAIQAFTEANRLLARDPAHPDGPSQTLLARCLRLLDHPPLDWDGLWDLHGA